MLIIILSLLGIPLWFLLALIGVAIKRRKWLQSRPGTFACAARVTSGNMDIVGEKWNRGFGRWENDVFVFARVPSLYSFAATPVMSLDAGQVWRTGPKEINFMSGHLVVLPVVVESGANVEIAVKPEHLAAAAGPFEIPTVFGIESSRLVAAPA